MRAPRYKFPEEVRSTTRSIAARMVREGGPAQTAEELDLWISQAPDVRERLVKGGYGTAFTAHDLLPLLHVFVKQAGGSIPEPDAPPPPSKKPWLVGLVVLLALVLLVLALTSGRW